MKDGISQSLAKKKEVLRCSPAVQLSWKGFMCARNINEGPVTDMGIGDTP